MYKFKFADIGEGIHEGKVFDIFVKEGQAVKDGDNLLSVETDKITAEIPSPVSGKIAKILVKKGQVIHVGEDMFEIDDGSTTAATPSKPATKENVEEGGASVVGEVKVSNESLSNIFGPKAKKTASSPSSVTAPKSGSGSVNLNGSSVLATPLARAIASEKGLNINSLSGTGPNGRVTKDDVLNSSSQPAKASAAPAQPASSASGQAKPVTKPQLPSQQDFFGESKEKRIPVSAIRNAISKAMTNSWTHVAYTNLVNEVDMENLMALRDSVKSDFEERGIKVTYLAYIVKAVAHSLELFHEFNATYDEAKNELIFKRDINIGIAVDSPFGLFVPVIKNTNHLTVTQIATEIVRLAGLARLNKLAIGDITGGTFSITNFGSVGSMFGVPVIKYPEMGIVGVGTITTRPKFNSKNEVVAGHFMNLTVAGDHRWVDGANIGRFAAHVKKLLETPGLFLH